MYKLICLCTCFIQAKSQQGGESNPGPLTEILSTLTPLLAAPMQSGQSQRLYLLLNLEVGDVRPAPVQPPPQGPSPRHHVASPSLDMDLLKAEISGEAGLGTADVAEHC